ncbi:unnamed protein product, partial [marine sediment metagenome]
QYMAQDRTEYSPKKGYKKYYFSSSFCHKLKPVFIYKNIYKK